MFGEEAAQEQIQVTISEENKAHVMHELKIHPSPISLELLDGTISNLKVTDIDGNDVEYGTSGEKIISILLPNKKTIVEYDLDDVIKNNSGVWTWVVNYPETILFNFPNNIDLIYVNERPVKIDDSPLNCHGCGMKLQYIIDEPVLIEKVFWEEKEFDISITSLQQISSFSFNQPSKMLSFDINGGGYVTLVIPLELLWNPYEVSLNNEKIFKHEFFSNGTHVWLNMRPNSGTVQIVGTTVVPEFPLLAPLFLGITIVIVLQLKNKLVSTRTT